MECVDKSVSEKRGRVYFYSHRSHDGSGGAHRHVLDLVVNAERGFTFLLFVKFDQFTISHFHLHFPLLHPHLQILHVSQTHSNITVVSSLFQAQHLLQILQAHALSLIINLTLLHKLPQEIHPSEFGKLIQQFPAPFQFHYTIHPPFTFTIEQILDTETTATNAFISQ